MTTRHAEDRLAEDVRAGWTRMVILEPLPPGIEGFLESRQALGQDRHDEVWEGVYHMTPGPSNAHGCVQAELLAVLRPHALEMGLIGGTEFNLGEVDDYRVPDGGYHREILPGVRMPTAAIVVEILSPGDETFEKFDFYARHGVEEIIVADPQARTVNFWRVSPQGEFVRTVASHLLQVEATDVTAAINWP